MAAEAEDRIHDPDGSYSFIEKKHSEESSHVTPTIQIAEVDEQIPDNLLKSPNRGIQISGDDDEVTLRRFNSSDFEGRERMEEANGRCIMERAILIDGNLDVILKYLQHEAGTDQNKNKIEEICSVCSRMPLHKNVLRILGVLHEYNRVALVSVYQEGDVCDWVKKQEYDQQQYSEVSIQMGEGLNHLHKYDIIHRDVAIRNFLINIKEGINVQICDFEMGRLLTDMKKMYVFDRFKEKIPWQNSPVEALLFDAHTTESDVYSFGITLWELLKRGQVPFETRTRRWVADELKSFFSAAQILDMGGIPPKMKLLIECCTIRLKEKRPKMSDVVKYLKEGGIEEFELQSSPEYFKKIIERKRMYNNQGEIRYGDLEIKDDLPPLERMERVYPKSPFVDENLVVRRGEQQKDDVELRAFFTILINPKKTVQHAEVDKYVKMCDYLGIYYESELREYLTESNVEDLKSDFFFLKVFPSRRIAKHLIKHDPQTMASVSKKMREVTIYLNENPKKFQELNVRLDNYFPDSDAGKTVLASNIRGEASNAGITTRVGDLKEGSIIATLFMTSDNLKRFKKQLEDGTSILRTRGTFFPTAELIGECIFRDEPVTTPEVDAFAFPDFLPSQERLDCASLLFKYGIYNDSDLNEFLSDDNIEEELKLMDLQDSCRSMISQWVEYQKSKIVPTIVPTQQEEQKISRQDQFHENTTKTTGEIPARLHSDSEDGSDSNFEIPTNPDGSYYLIDLGSEETQDEPESPSHVSPDSARRKRSPSREPKGDSESDEEDLPPLEEVFDLPPLEEVLDFPPFQDQSLVSLGEEDSEQDSELYVLPKHQELLIPALERYVRRVSIGDASPERADQQHILIEENLPMLRRRRSDSVSSVESLSSRASDEMIELFRRLHLGNQTLTGFVEEDILDVKDLLSMEPGEMERLIPKTSQRSRLKGWMDDPSKSPRTPKIQHSREQDTFVRFRRSSWAMRQRRRSGSDSSVGSLSSQPSSPWATQQRRRSGSDSSVGSLSNQPSDEMVDLFTRLDLLDTLSAFVERGILDTKDLFLMEPDHMEQLIPLIGPRCRLRAWMYDSSKPARTQEATKQEKLATFTSTGETDNVPDTQVKESKNVIQESVWNQDFVNLEDVSNLRFLDTQEPADNQTLDGINKTKGKALGI